MSLRWKIALAMAVISSVATVAIGVATYRSTSDRLLAEVDRSLADLDAFASGRRVDDPSPLPARGPLSGIEAQIFGADGTVSQSTFDEPIPVTAEDLALVGLRRGERFSTVMTPEGEYRVRTVSVFRGGVQVARSLAETDRILGGLRARILLLVTLVGGVSTAAGWWIASRVTASLRRLTDAAVHVGATGRLDVKVGTGGSDEVGTLAGAFDRMLVALARSNDEKHRLVQDAGHELRTPLTSLRTNLDALRRFPDMSDADRSAIVDDLRAETTELTDLVNEIVAVASGAGSDEPWEPFDLAELVRDVAERSSRRTSRAVVVAANPTPVIAQRASVQRAVSSLLDNADKFDRTGGAIDVTVHGGTVTVGDRGPGIAPEELELVFERFHRAESARSMPGSGLGLSIVRDVALRHGGHAVARQRDGGGVDVEFSIMSRPDTSASAG